MPLALELVSPSHGGLRAGDVCRAGCGAGVRTLRSGDDLHAGHGVPHRLSADGGDDLSAGQVRMRPVQLLRVVRLLRTGIGGNDLSAGDECRLSSRFDAVYDLPPGNGLLGKLLCPFLRSLQHDDVQSGHLV